MKSTNRSVKKAIFAFVLLLFTFNLQAQLLSGVIKNADFKPLGNVLIKVTGTETQVMTNAEGRFSITMPSGNATLEISKDGFNSEVINIKSNQTSLDVLLIPDLYTAMNKSIKRKKCQKHTLLSNL